VLEVLAGQQPVVSKKYPEEELHFNNNNWRGFYHCHDSPGKHQAEHGHFHVFVRIDTPAGLAEQWAHLVALAMNFDGQPVAWFTVNQWVTDGAWCKAPELVQKLDSITFSGQLSLVEKWLLAMLQAYRETIAELLHQRDQSLIQINEKYADSDILHNRDVYALSSSAVSLKIDLGRVTQAS